MVVPEDLGDSAQNGDQDRVFAWLDAGGDINDADPQGFTLLGCCACGSTDYGGINAPQMALARSLLARGADVNRAYSSPEDEPPESRIYGDGDTALHHASVNTHAGCLDMIALLIEAKANVNARNDGGKTPLWRALHQEAHHKYLPDRNQYGLKLRHVLDIVRVLLRHGALLDCGSGNVTYSAEDKLASFKHADDETVIAIKALIAGVRKHGTYKKYMRAPHREFLAVRGLAQRGKLAVPHWPTARPGQLFGELSNELCALNFIARLGDNGVCWHILTYWRGTD